MSYVPPVNNAIQFNLSVYNAGVASSTNFNFIPATNIYMLLRVGDDKYIKVRLK
jgi:hypothetical protein